MLIVVAAYIFTHVFSGRGALIHVGAFVGTIMAVNVFGVIIPNQKKIVAALIAGEAPDPALGAIGKQRSVHNNYLTLPVLLMMVSNHYPMLSGHRETWLVVALILVDRRGGAPFPQPPRCRRSVRQDRLDAAGGGRGARRRRLPDGAARRLSHCRHRGERRRGARDRRQALRHVPFARSERTTASTRRRRTSSSASLDDLRRHADQIMAQAVNGNAMPLGNETGMTDEERRSLARAS